MVVIHCLSKLQLNTCGVVTLNGLQIVFHDHRILELNQIDDVKMRIEQSLRQSPNEVKKMPPGFPRAA